jgi:hypothetical protein
LFALLIDRRREIGHRMLNRFRRSALTGCGVHAGGGGVVAGLEDDRVEVEVGGAADRESACEEYVANGGRLAAGSSRRRPPAGGSWCCTRMSVSAVEPLKRLRLAARQRGSGRREPGLGGCTLIAAVRRSRQARHGWPGGLANDPGMTRYPQIAR